MERYSRHTVLPEIGEKGQRALDGSRVLIVGLGGLGSVLSDTLVRSGVGEVKIIDDDTVEISNLQRQTLYDEGDLGEPKAEAAAHRLMKINTSVEIEWETVTLDGRNAEGLVREVDIVLDGTDNMDTRYILNDACVKNDTPWVFTAVMGTYGMTLNVLPGEGPCLRCLIPEEPGPNTLESGAEAGILFTLPRVLANIASTEVVKYLIGAEMRDQLFTVDLWKDEYGLTEVSRSQDCPCCVREEYDHLI